MRGRILRDAGRGAAQDTGAGHLDQLPMATHDRRGENRRMAFDAFALILTMLGIGMLFARLRVLPGLDRKE